MNTKRSTGSFGESLSSAKAVFQRPLGRAGRENQGAWPYFIIETNKLGPRPVSVVARAYAASSATGSAKRHATDQAELVRRALTL